MSPDEERQIAQQAVDRTLMPRFYTHKTLMDEMIRKTKVLLAHEYKLEVGVFISSEDNTGIYGSFIYTAWAPAHFHVYFKRGKESSELRIDCQKIDRVSREACAFYHRIDEIDRMTLCDLGQSAMSWAGFLSTPGKPEKL